MTQLELYRIRNKMKTVERRLCISSLKKKSYKINKRLVDDDCVARLRIKRNSKRLLFVLIIVLIARCKIHNDFFFGWPIFIDASGLLNNYCQDLKRRLSKIDQHLIVLHSIDAKQTYSR